MTTLLASNYKLDKAVPGYALIGLSLAPHTVAGGRSVCPYSTVECRAVCLGTETGMNRFETALKAKVERTKLWQNEPAKFKAQLMAEIGRARRRAARNDLKLGVRLNVYSDVAWEREYPELFAEFADVTFYDYTKVPGRFDRPRNYHLTYSYTGTPASLKTATEYLAARVNPAIVYSGELPNWSLFGFGKVRKLRVLNGDANDFRPGDPWPRIVGLRFKGGAGNLVNIRKFVQQEQVAP
jgi:hypothetical protein